MELPPSVIKVITIIGLLLLAPLNGWAALTCADANVATLYDSTPADPETISYTTPAGSNQIVFVGVGQRTGAAPRTHTATIGGQSMSLATTEAYQDPIGAALYYLINPPSGTNNVVVDWGVGGAPLADTIIIFTCSDADTGGFRSTNQAQGTSTSPSVTLGTVSVGDLVVDFHASESASTPTEGANQTVIAKGNAGAEISGGASFQAGADGGVMSWTILNNDWGTTGVVVKPFSASTRRASSPVVMP